jgi:YfiH family protein
LNKVELVAGWEAYPWLRAAFSTRVGGVSLPYGDGRGELNLGWTKDDAPEAVAENRRRLVEAVAGDRDAMQLVTMAQVHSADVQVIEAGHGPLATPEGRGVLRGDGLMTAKPGLLLGIQTADCVPVLLADVRQRVVAGFHAGWRGTLARIVEQGVGLMRSRYGSRVEDLVAAVGPAIGACCYAVGEEVQTGFAGEFGYAAELFRAADGVVRLDLHAANRRQLLEAGVGAERISVLGECTACTRLEDGSRKYFSHRAECGVTGRMLSVIGVG